MKRDNTGLRAETDQRHQKREGSHPFRQRMLRMPEGLECERPPCLKKDQEGHNDERGPDMGHDEVEQTRVAHVGFLVLRHHEEIGQQRHQFPDDEKEKAVVREHDEGHGTQKPIEERSKHRDRCAPIKMPYVANGIDRRGETGEGDGQHEECRQWINPNGEGEQRNCGGQ